MCIEKKSLLNVVATTMGTIFFENAIIRNGENHQTACINVQLTCVEGAIECISFVFVQWRQTASATQLNCIYEMQAEWLVGSTSHHIITANDEKFPPQSHVRI